MLVWLDGDTNTKAKPQENFGRELMELFTRGVGYYTEDDVYAAARVFTGWNLNARRPRRQQRVVQLRLQREPARDQREDLQLSDLQRRQPHDSGALGGGRDAGRPRSDQRAGDASRNGAAAGDEAVRVLRQRDGAAGSGFIDRARDRLPAERHGDQAGAAACCSRRRSSRIRRSSSRATRGRSSSSCAR